MKHAKILFVVSVIVFLAIYLLISTRSKTVSTPLVKEQLEDSPAPRKMDFTGKRVLEIDAYHEGFQWTAGITKGVRSVIEPTGAEFKVFRMDTKRQTSEEFKKSVALKAKDLIETWKPDVVIASDDNVSKYLLVPYYRNKTLPIVFCGVNWDANDYAFPCSNITGQLEVTHIRETVELLLNFAKGKRLGIITGDTFTERKDVDNFKKRLNIVFTRECFVKNWDEFKKDYVELQKEVDLMILGSLAGFRDQIDDETMRNFILSQTTIPTGAYNEGYAPFALLGVVKDPEEIGRWAGETALKILNGAKPESIPLAVNKEGKLILNFDMAEKLKITFDPDWLDHAILLRKAR